MSLILRDNAGPGAELLQPRRLFTREIDRTLTIDRASEGRAVCSIRRRIPVAVHKPLTEGDSREMGRWCMNRRRGADTPGGTMNLRGADRKYRAPIYLTESPIVDC